MALIPHVLVVCQDPARFDRIAEILHLGGYQASRTSPGASILESILQKEFDAIVIDPASDSVWETLRTLRQLRSAAQILLIMYAGGLPEAHALLIRNRAQRLGVTTLLDPNMTGTILLDGLRLTLTHSLFASFA